MYTYVYKSNYFRYFQKIMNEFHRYHVATNATKFHVGSKELID